MVVEINVYQTEALTEKNDRNPEKVVARYLRSAFDRADMAHRVRAGFEPVSVESQQSVCGEGDALDEWGPMIKNEDVDVAKDSNLLITAAGGGGCGYVGGNRAVGPGANITADIPYVEEGRGRIHANIHGCLHEVGHNLGAKHDHDREKKGAQHYGTGWNEDAPTLFGVSLSFLPNFDDAWHRTPTVAGNGSENECGEYIPERKHNTVVRHQYYHDCAIENFEIQ